MKVSGISGVSLYLNSKNKWKKQDNKKEKKEKEVENPLKIKGGGGYDAEV